jgi:hypothetical protein
VSVCLCLFVCVCVRVCACVGVCVCRSDAASSISSVVMNCCAVVSCWGGMWTTLTQVHTIIIDRIQYWCYSIMMLYQICIYSDTS